jgi:Domain of unknown function (DUF4403)
LDFRHNILSSHHLQCVNLRPVGPMARHGSGPVSIGTAVLVTVMAGCGTQEIQAPPPVIAGESIDTAVAPPPSYVSAPIELDLRPLLAELERGVPVRVGSLDAADRIRLDGTPTVWLAAQLERGPLRFTFRDSTISLTTVFHYRVRAWLDALVLQPSISCGTGGVRPRMRVSVRTTYRITSRWRIHTRSRVVSVEPLTDAGRDRCRVSFLGVDVTDRVMAAARHLLASALRRADSDLGRVDLGRPIGGLWATLQQPLSVAHGRYWFAIRPHAIYLGQITATDSSLTAMLSLLASPRFVSGPRPVVTATALPALQRGPGADSVYVLIQGLLRYPAVGALLQKELAHRSIRVGWRRLRIDRVTAMDGGGGRVILAVDLEGRAHGRVYVVGTPTYDATTDTISIPDLGFDVNSESYLDQGLGWLVNGPLLPWIRQNARIPAARLLEIAVGLADQQLDRELADGVWLSGTIGSARTLRVRATNRGIAAVAMAVGRLGLRISKQDTLPSIPNHLVRLGAGHP